MVRSEDIRGYEKTEPGRNTLKCAVLLSRLEVFKISLDRLKKASMMQKADQAVFALEKASELFTDLTFLTHEYALRAVQLEDRIKQLEVTASYQQKYLNKVEG